MSCNRLLMLCLSTQVKSLGLFFPKLPTSDTFPASLVQQKNEVIDSLWC